MHVLDKYLLFLYDVNYDLDSLYACASYVHLFKYEQKCLSLV
jgi:hypothetical protein